MEVCGCFKLHTHAHTRTCAHESGPTTWVTEDLGCVSHKADFWQAVEPLGCLRSALLATGSADASEALWTPSRSVAPASETRPERSRLGVASFSGAPEQRAPGMPRLRGAGPASAPGISRTKS